MLVDSGNNQTNQKLPGEEVAVEAAMPAQRPIESKVDPFRLP